MLLFHDLEYFSTTFGNFCQNSLTFLTYKNPVLLALTFVGGGKAYSIQQVALGNMLGPLEVYPQTINNPDILCSLI